jgi:hypothetical protein
MAAETANVAMEYIFLTDESKIVIVKVPAGDLSDVGVAVNSL